MLLVVLSTSRFETWTTAVHAKRHCCAPKTDGIECYSCCSKGVWLVLGLCLGLNYLSWLFVVTNAVHM